VRRDKTEREREREGEGEKQKIERGKRKRGIGNPGLSGEHFAAKHKTKKGFSNGGIIDQDRWRNYRRCIRP